MSRQRNAKAAPSSDTEPLIKISEDEQWRLINESGVLHKITDRNSGDDSEVKSDDPSPYPLVDEILDTGLLIIPFCFLLLLMDMCAL